MVVCYIWIFLSFVVEFEKDIIEIGEPIRVHLLARFPNFNLPKKSPQSESNLQYFYISPLVS